MPARRRSPIPVLAAAAGNRTSQSSAVSTRLYRRYQQVIVKTLGASSLFAQDHPQISTGLSNILHALTGGWRGSLKKVSKDEGPTAGVRFLGRAQRAPLPEFGVEGALRTSRQSPGRKLIFVYLGFQKSPIFIRKHTLHLPF